MGGPLRALSTRAVAHGSVLVDPHAPDHAVDVLLGAYGDSVNGSVVYTELRNLVDLGHLQPALDRQGYAFEGHLNFLVDVSRPAAAVWNDIRSSAQRNVRKARSSGVVIEDVDDREGLQAAHGVLAAVYQRLQVPLPDLSFFEAALAILVPAGMLRIVVAKVNGAPIGTLCLLAHNGVVTYWYTGTLREHAAHRAGDLLVWHALEWSSACGFHLFDFGGGGRPGEEYGVRDFKAKFGGELVNFGRNVRVHGRLRMRVSQAGYQVARRFL